MTKILAIGDVVGKAGRRCLDKMLPKLREELSPDLVIVNAENSAGGFGITKKIYHQLTDKMGIDCLTMGNHWHDKREIYDFIDSADKMVLPANMSNVDDDRKGLKIIKARNGVSCAVINLSGRAFMHGSNRCPFTAVDKLLESVPSTVKIRVVDMHAEATSEKQGMGWYLAGRASVVYGSHCHVQTADERILEKTTGFLTDIGMTGAYESIIGIRVQAGIHRLLTGEKKRFEPATGDPWLCGIITEINDETGECIDIQRVRWKLSEHQ